MTFHPRSSVSIDGENEMENSDSNDATPLRLKILELVKESPNHTIRPSKLSQKLGLSINDANAELCGLLQVVGDGSSFHFETIGATPIMVFTFPPDFERRALREQRKRDWIASLRDFGEWLIKAIKVLTAFGLIISIVIVSIAGMLALIAAFVALSRGGRNTRGSTNRLANQMHNLFLTVRQLLWCYAMFGPDSSGQDPFFREAAYDSWLVLCGDPRSFFFWWRASHLRQRRQRYTRGWGSHIAGSYEDAHSDVEGVTLIQRNRRTGEGEVQRVPNPRENHGLLSSLVEFLFGPSISPEPSEADKWRLRQAVIVDKATKNKDMSVSLLELVPFSDSPPKSLDDNLVVMQQGLAVVAHFNGVPCSKMLDQLTTDGENNALFTFPELISESHETAQYVDTLLLQQGQELPENQSRWSNFLYTEEKASETTVSDNARRELQSFDLPIFLYERPRSFSLLSRNQFWKCFLIAILNFVGVIWFSQSIQPTGILHGYLNASVNRALRTILLPVLMFYAHLFLLIPFSRMIYLMLWNEQCRKRNEKRALLAALLGNQKAITT